jgi:hypothetical protein
MTRFVTLFNCYHRDVLSLALSLTGSQKCLFRMAPDTSPRRRQEQERQIVAAIRERSNRLLELLKTMEALCEGK